MLLGARAGNLHISYTEISVSGHYDINKMFLCWLTDLLHYCSIQGRACFYQVGTSMYAREAHVYACATYLYDHASKLMQLDNHRSFYIILDISTESSE